MKKILFVLPSISQNNGISSFLMNYLKNINLENYKIDILASDYNPSKTYIDFLNSSKINIYFLPFLRNSGLRKYVIELRKFFKEHHDYDCIYSNVANQSMFIFKEAKKYKIKNRILHSHATVSSDNKIKRILNDICIKSAIKNATQYIACSELAGKAMFGTKKFVVINNAIDYDKFRFSENNRNKIRKELGIDNKKVIGFVGRFSPQKNVFFFIDFAKKLDDNTVILMIGSGVEKEPFLEKIKYENLENKFIMINECSNVYEYYSAMDLFMLPSLYEGLPLVAVEAQVSGLPCLLSNNITNECKILNETTFLSIDDLGSWITCVNSYKSIDRNNVKLEDKFNIKVQAKKFENILFNLLIKEKM